MNENRLRTLMADSVDGVGASDALRVRVSAAVDGRIHRRRAVTRGWIAVGGAGLAAAAVLLVVPLVRPPSSAPTGSGLAPSVAVTTSSTTASVTGNSSAGRSPVADVGAVLGNKTWYVVGIVERGTSLVLDPPTGSDGAMRIHLTGSVLDGYDGCNWLYVDPAVLTSVPSGTVAMSRTAGGCDPVPAGQRQFIEALQSGPKSWSLSGDEVLLDAGGIELQLSTDEGLVVPSATTVDENLLALIGSRPWYVTRIVVGRSPIEVFTPSDRALAMRIQIKGSDLTGFDGCNQVGARSAVLSSAPPTTVEWSQTDAGCSPIPAGQEEFTAALRDRAKTWAKIDGNLVLTTSSAEITFSPDPPTSASSTG